MINKLAKSLVLVHTVFSLAGLAYGIFVFLQAKDFGRAEPSKEVLEYNADGTAKSSVRHASAYDKSAAAYSVAVASRDRTYAQVKPALDLLARTEPFLPENHLFFVAELDRLKKATDKIEVKRLMDGGVSLDAKDFGKPVLDDEALANVTKSRAEYENGVSPNDAHASMSWASIREDGRLR